jgi:4-hydroxybutyrate CoA-transferase
MHWIESYRSKIKTADEAVAAIHSGDRVLLHQGCSEPEALVAAMLRRAGELRNVEIFHMATFGNADYTLPEYEGVFRHTASFIGANVREAVQAGRADYIPMFLHEIEGLFRSGALPIDVALIQCTPPDDYGYMSLGAGIDVTLTGAQYARHVIVEVNDQAPRTLGDSFLHVNKADAIVEASHPLPEYKKCRLTEVHHRIAAHVAPLIPDGATIQTGIGGIPEAVLLALRDHKDLGIHSEMFSDELIDLIELGVVNNERKTIHPHKVIAGFVLGTRKLFDFIDNNPIFEFHPTSYVNDPFIIAQNDRMVAINGAIEIDLTGQVCADSIGHLPYSGIGGQVDFIRGAAHSKGGVPIIALASTAKNGALSRIVPALKPGAGVVTSRGDVHYVITEFGVAYLHGKNLRQRAEALIQIAHPDYRARLEDAARNHGSLEKRPEPVG